MARVQKFFVCKHCGNLVSMIHESGVPIICCGEPMQALEPNTSEGAGEKHLPVIEQKGGEVTVKVGSVPHPMLPEHSIQWIYLCTQLGGQRHILDPGNAPQATFILAPGDKVVAAYEYCNIHGLWKTQA